MITIKKINISSSNSEEWSKFHSFRRQFFNECDPEIPIIDDASEEVFLKHDILNPDVKMFYFRVYDELEVIGTFYYSYFLESSKSYKGNEKLLDLILKF